VAECLVVAVDGPSGSGKSSAARRTAQALGLRYLDTGAMYRALTWWLLAGHIDIDDPAAVAARAAGPVIEVSTDPDAPSVAVDGADVTGPIRGRPVSNAVSAVASVPEVRRHLIARQREIIARACAEAGGIVAPNAAVKVFLTASETARARRRAADLAADPAVTVELTRAEQARRDRLDAPQSERAADAVPIDSTALDVAGVVATIVGLAQARQAADGSRAARPARRT
jgi:cytidylate kinase